MDYCIIYSNIVVSLIDLYISLLRKVFIYRIHGKSSTVMRLSKLEINNNNSAINSYIPLYRSTIKSYILLYCRVLIPIRYSINYYLLDNVYTNHYHAYKHTITKDIRLNK